MYSAFSCSLRKANARKGIKTDEDLEPDHLLAGLFLSLRKANARKGIKTARIDVGAHLDLVDLLGLRKANARKGIKTGSAARRGGKRQGFAGLRKANARKGIKTIPSSTEARAANAQSEESQCSQGH